MPRNEQISQIVIAAHTLARIAATSTRNDAPAAQWRALSALLTDGPLRLGALATAARTTQPGMTRLIGQLAEQGLVRRDRDPEDSRVSVISITDEGERSLLSWRIELGEALAPLFADLDDEEWSTLTRAADILTARTLHPHTPTTQGAPE